MAGAYPLMENLARLTKIDRGAAHDPVAISPDGNYSIEFVECLASCGTAPVCMVDDDLHENISPESAPDLLARHSSPVTHHSTHPRAPDGFQNIGRG
jgi:NADH-quinone oxidoreductase subunit E